MRRPSTIAATALCALLLMTLAGCGSTDDATPVACLDGPAAYVGALGDAPGQVLLSGEAPISDCLAANQEGGELATIGESLLDAATQLNAEARAEPGGSANLQLGYLLGAVERGSAQTSGIHAELVRRLAAAARYSPDNRPLPPRFASTYRRGFDAGHARG
jgi:hypothetical protein